MQHHDEVDVNKDGLLTKAELVEGGEPHRRVGPHVAADEAQLQVKC